MRPGTRRLLIVVPSIRSEMVPTAIAMNSEELVKANSCPPIWPSGTRVLIWNCWIGSAMCSILG